MYKITQNESEFDELLTPIRRRLNDEKSRKVLVLTTFKQNFLYALVEIIRNNFEWPFLTDT